MYLPPGAGVYIIYAPWTLHVYSAFFHGNSFTLREKKTKMPFI
jgi:hypothetical protein